MKIVQRVPPVSEWPGLRRGPGHNEEGIHDFMRAMALPLRIYDELEQVKWQTPQDPPGEEQKPRTWLVLNFADEYGFGYSTLCGVPLIGQFSNERKRFQRSSGLVVEKTTRLGLAHDGSSAQIASSQSANDKKEEYGGAIWLPGNVNPLRNLLCQVGASGLPGGFADEAAVLYAACAARWMSVKDANHIAKITGNTEWSRFEEPVDILTRQGRSPD